MIWSLLLALLALSVPILVTVSFRSVNWAAVALTDLSVLGLLALTRLGRLRFVGFAVPVVLLALATASAVISDGTHDVAVTGYMVVIAVAGLLGGAGALVVFAMLSIVAYGLIAIAEISGALVTAMSHHTRGGDIVIFTTICTVFALLLRVLLLHLVDSLQLAESNQRALSLRNAELEASQTEVQRLNAELEARIIARTADLQALAEANERLYREQVDIAERLRAADEVKSRFMANMSHELRTPLNAVLNFTRFVSSGMLGPVNAEQLDALTKTIASGKHLLNLINDVLDVTKIESQMLTLFVESDISLSQEIDASIAACEPMLEGKPVTLVREIDPALPPVVGDRRRLRQVMLNLLSNACKHTLQGAVNIDARHMDDHVIIKVTDTGPGIPADELELIFEPFRQAKRGMIAGGGTGLGLAIARRLVEAHHGQLTVSSQPGAGATFTVSLPVDSSALRAQLGSIEAQP